MVLWSYNTFNKSFLLLSINMTTVYRETIFTKQEVTVNMGHGMVVLLSIMQCDTIIFTDQEVTVNTTTATVNLQKMTTYRVK